MNLPRISVITICRNAESVISNAVESVIGGGYPNMEYIVIDGGSTDKTLSVLAKYSQHIDVLVSEPDDGIADAMNKGIALSTGDFHFLLHADDTLFPGALTKLGAVADSPQVMVVAGCARVMFDGRMTRLYKPEPKSLTMKMSLPHMGCVVRKSAWEAVGGYDKRRKVAMDHLFMLRILKRYGLPAFRTADVVVAEYNAGGASDLQIYRGFRELRDNLVEEGYGHMRSNLAYAVLCAKGFTSRVLRRLG